MASERETRTFCGVGFASVLSSNNGFRKLKNSSGFDMLTLRYTTATSQKAGKHAKRGSHTRRKGSPKCLSLSLRFGESCLNALWLLVFKIDAIWSAVEEQALLKAKALSSFFEALWRRRLHE